MQPVCFCGQPSEGDACRRCHAGLCSGHALELDGWCWSCYAYVRDLPTTLASAPPLLLQPAVPYVQPAPPAEKTRWDKFKRLMNRKVW